MALVEPRTSSNMLHDRALAHVPTGSRPNHAPESPNALTIDVEDYFQVEAFAKLVDRGRWDDYPSRVGRNTGELLDLLAEAGAVATFFTLGWVAERNHNLIHRIMAEGHELASHGFDHRRVDQQTSQEFRADVRRSKQVLEDIAGAPVLGYRAPTFSVGRG